MPIESANWNVVVAGYWNPAILTPAGIAVRLFGLPPGTPVVVEVPIQGLLPSRVRHDNLTVTAEVGRLVVTADEPKYDLLDRGRLAAVRGITGLPETPLAAAGFNVRFRITDPPDNVLSAPTCPIDALLSDAGFCIDSRGIRRSMKIGNGILNLNIQEDGEKDVTIEFNFHRESQTHGELEEWLRFPIEEVQNTVTTIMDKVLQVPAEGGGA